MPRDMLVVASGEGGHWVPLALSVRRPGPGGGAHILVHWTAPQQRISCPRMVMVLRLKNPRLSDLFRITELEVGGSESQFLLSIRLSLYLETCG